ncbi:MAG TPA: sigma-70 family RNA polymerase sigma factor [Candidatus Acidoferrales bacterium]|nr:sigma-70 family RNA polymerase sigma factor [Candidatus Acidoferrales bacterium]
MLLIPELDLIIGNGFSEGQERFGNLGLELQTYSQRVHSIIHKHLGVLPQPQIAIEFVKGLHGPDLYLATSCAQNCPGTSDGNLQAAASDNSSVAWKTLEKTYKGFICDLVRFFYSTTFAAQDLADSILADLFLPDRSGSSRIASYDGKSSLSTWLRVVVCNRAINAKRCSAVVKNTDIQADIPDGPALQNIELTVRAKRYGKALGDSLATACRGLTPRERLILLWRYEDGLQLGQIARLLGIHQSNVTRQLERMQHKLRDEVVAVLSRKHGLSSLAINECIQDIVENPCHGISILDFIKERSAGHSGGLPTAPNKSTLEPSSKAIQSSRPNF